MQIIVNGQPRRVSDGSTIAELLEELGLKNQYVAVERNLRLVPRARHDEEHLHSGDRLEIVTLVGGG